MPRPAKPVELQSKHNTKSDIKKRQSVQNSLKGDSSCIVPPYKLSESQLNIFNKIRDVYNSVDLIGELDVYTLAEGAVVIDRLQQLEMMINNDPTLLTDKEIMMIRKGYTQDYYRLCNELGLSPQSRAKLGSLSLQKDKQNNDTLLQLLKGSG